MIRILRLRLKQRVIQYRANQNGRNDHSRFAALLFLAQEHEERNGYCNVHKLHQLIAVGVERVAGGALAGSRSNRKPLRAAVARRAAPDGLIGGFVPLARDFVVEERPKIHGAMDQLIHTRSAKSSLHCASVAS